MTHATAEPLPFQTIGIVGCGLIGCSIGAALKKRGFPGRIVGCGRAGANLTAAADRGHVDFAETDLAKAAEQCDLIVACTPVDRVVETVRAAASGCRKGALITDAGSVKRIICEALSAALPSGVTFVGSHPIAGSEKQGCQHADPDLFVDHVCVITPSEVDSRSDVDRLTGFWRSLGMTVIEMSAEAHDRILAQTSHVPHVVAAALAATLSPANRRLAAGGFRDTTRVAAGDPALWSAILAANAADVATGIRAVSEQLAEFLLAIETHDKKTLRELLRRARANRDAVMFRETPPDADVTE